MHRVDAVALEQWADRIESRSDFPSLVRRLIQQTNDQVTALEMRGGEGTGFAGYDGRVEADRATPLVPAGLSVWELGTGRSPETKANVDYKERTADPLGVDKSTATFVFSTPRRWAGKGAWVAARRAEGDWADVRVFDADDLETAFESAPAAHFWLSELIGLPVDGLQMVETWWEAFAQQSNPSLRPELVLAGRSDQAAELLRLLEEDTRLTTVSAPSTDDGLAFIASTLFSSPERTRAELISRALVIHDAATLRRLEVTANLLILLPFDEELRRQAQLVRSHHVVLVVPEAEPADIALGRLDRDLFRALLVQEDVAPGIAESLALAAHRSLVAFQRDAPARGTSTREWTATFGARIPRRAWLAGGWQDVRTGDTDALSMLFGVRYDGAVPELQPLTTGDDPVFTTVGGSWGLTSVDEAWRYGCRLIDSSDLAALESLIQTVLGAVDPALELPLDERWLADVRGLARVHSSDLRRGLATTLATCGALGGAVEVGGRGRLSDWAEAVVSQLLRRANEDTTGHLWVSLADALPLLAEAAPSQFLRAVQEGTAERSEPLLVKMFLDRESGDALSISSPHTAMLWALETLAWSPDHAPLALEQLARLAEVDPGGRLSNRPLNSLADVFRPWLPQTTLGVDRRITVLDAIRRDHPETSWKLMLKLLPEHHAVGTFTHKPRFRDWRREEEGATQAELLEFCAAVAQRLLSDAGSDPARWLDIVEQLARFPGTARAEAVEQLAVVAGSAEIPGEPRERLWRKLDEQVRHHRAFPEADWVLPAGDLDLLAEAAEHLKPDDEVRAGAWLFDQHLPDMGDARADFYEQERRAESARAAAVRAVIESEGAEGLLRLADSTSFPRLVGLSAASQASPELDVMLVQLLDNEHAKLVELGGAYAYRRLRDESRDWLQTQLELLANRPVAQARLLQESDDVEAAWRTARDLGDDVESKYWSEFQPYGRGHDFQPVNDAATSLLRFGRPVAALDLLSLYLRAEDRRVSTELVFDALQALLELTTDHPETGRISDYELRSLLEYLHQADFDEERLGLLEWQLLPALGFDARSPVLERRLARDPVFFVQLLSLAYRPNSETDAESPPPHTARNAYRLLGEWRIVPGSADRQAVVDVAELVEWIDNARQLAAKADRPEVGDLEIGKVFAHARTDDDGTWPTGPVRDVIEQLASSELEDGLRTQTFNNRGPTTRGLLDGGDQERVLVQRYDELAALIRDGWPRTAAVLSSLARSYEREAGRLDEEAERSRQGMDR